MSQDEFDNLVSSQAILAKNFVASQALAAQKRAEELTIRNGRARGDEDRPIAVGRSLASLDVTMAQAGSRKGNQPHCASKPLATMPISWRRLP